MPNIIVSNPYVDVGPPFVVDLPNSTQSASRTVTDPADANAGWWFYTDGKVDRRQGSWSYHHDWGTPTGAGTPSDYQIRCTKNSGSTPTGSSLSTWMSLAYAKNWQLSQTAVGSKTCNLTIEIRDSSTLSVLDSQTYTISVEVQSGGTTTTTTTGTTATTATTGTTTEGTF